MCVYFTRPIIPKLLLVWQKTREYTPKQWKFKSRCRWTVCCSCLIPWELCLGGKECAVRISLASGWRWLEDRASGWLSVALLCFFSIWTNGANSAVIHAWKALRQNQILWLGIRERLMYSKQKSQI